MAESFTLSFAAVDVLSQGLRVDCRLFPFQFPAVGEFVADRLRILRAVREDLEERRLADEHGPAAPVADALRLMADYRVAVAVMGRVDGEDLYARVSADGQRGLVTVRQRTGFAFEFIRPGALPGVVAGLLPEVQAAPGTSVTVSGRPEVRQPSGNRQSGSLFDAADERATPETHRAAASDILRRPRRGSGYILVSGRDQAGKVIDAPRLGWIDTEDGRYLARSGTDSGEPTSTFHPADRGRLRHHLAELIAMVTPSR
jgi:hypothetical protein